MSKAETTQIQITKELAVELKALMGFGETYEIVIRRLLKNQRVGK